MPCHTAVVPGIVNNGGRYLSSHYSYQIVGGTPVIGRHCLLECPVNMSGELRCSCAVDGYISSYFSPLSLSLSHSLFCLGGDVVTVRPGI